MTLEKIHIKNRGTLVDFEAKFGPITVIYGPNASGKSLLSNALRSIERAKWCGPGEAEVTLNGRTLRSGDFAQGEYKDNVRVFNADFLRDDVIDGDPSAIVLGRAVVDQRDKIDRLTRQISSSESSRQASDEQMVRFKNSLGEGFQSAGEKVRTVLRTVPKNSGANPRWPNYDRRDAEKTYRAMLDEGRYVHHQRSPVRLEELEEIILHRESPHPLDLPHVDDPSVSDIYKRASVLLHTNLETTSLTEIEGDPDRRDWLLKGQEYSRDEAMCAFCHQHVPPDRANALESYFNDNLKRLLSDIDSMDQELELKISTLASVSLPPVGDLGIDLQDTYQERSARWLSNIESALTAIESVQSQLKSKKDRPNMEFDISTEPPVWDADAVIELNQVVDDHNQSINKLRRNCEEYELAVIANRFEEWKGLDDQITDLELKIETYDQQIAETSTKLVELRRSADTRLIAADELTRMVQSFLGHDEIGFELNDEDPSYQLTRHGESASDFSEGERTALALMYFLKRLEDDSFDKRNGTLVFDDPITSFDEDNLYRAVADIVTRTGMKDEAHDLQSCKVVIMTHHFGMFERLWMELRSKRVKGSAIFYEMRCQFVDSRRASKLVPLKNMLATDYMLAFYEVQSMANGCERINNPETSLRKCVEGFITRLAPGTIDQGLNSAYWSFVGKHDRVTVSNEDLQLIISIANGGSHLSAISQRAGSDRHRSTLQATSTNFLQLMSDAAPQHYGDLKAWYSRRVKQEARLKVESDT